MNYDGPIMADQILKLRIRIVELEYELKLMTKQRDGFHEKCRNYYDRKAALQKVVDAAKELVFGKSADSIDTDEYPALEKALYELNKTE